MLLAAGLPGCAEQREDSARWEQTIERVTRAVVTLRVNAPRAFDDGLPGFSTATGFIVDKRRGLILTNRHVVQPGPVVAQAVLLNHEELELTAVYRDPVHDFGFFRFDPAKVRFLELEELPLAPERARVGADTRVIGNDAGEQLSILAGTLARIDREAPSYGRGNYGDFNTFYFQAASSISGGSSGSPMINRDGQAIALAAGGNRESATSFFLPLDAAVRALAHIQRGEPVPRGSLRAIFAHRSYDELSRLGLAPEREAQVRAEFPGGSGLLVTEQVLPQGPASGVLEPGDILLAVDGRPLDSFAPLEVALDAGVGRKVALRVSRGSSLLELDVVPEDLHALAPTSYVEFGGGVLNALSLSLARHYALPVGGVMVALRGYLLGRAGLPHRAVITALDGVETPDLDAFQRVLAALPDGARVPLRYYELERSRTEGTGVLDIDRRWYPLRRCRLEDASGRWPCEELPSPARRPPPEVRQTSFEEPADEVGRALVASLVHVQFNVPFPLDGVHDVSFGGAGLVVDAERGLVLVDRETVPIALGDIELRFANSVRVPAELVYLHPEHNLAVVRYDPAQLGGTPVRSAQLDPAPLHVGEPIWQIGLTSREQLVSRATTVSGIEPLELPLPDSPRFREQNLELVSLADVSPSVGGVLADRSGRVRALWAAFSREGAERVETFVNGIPSARLLEIVAPLRAGSVPEWRTLGVEWRALSLARARDLGLPEAQARALEAAAGAGRRRVLSVARRRAGSPAAELLRDGDLLVAVDGQPTVDFAVVEGAAQKPQLPLQVVRDGKLLELSVATEPRSGRGTERALIWAGALLQAQPDEVALQRGLAPDGVYVSFYFFGSPADRDGLRATRRIEQLNDAPTPDLDAFVAALRNLPDTGPLRLRVRALDGSVEVVTLRLDPEYWPTWELRRGAAGWERRAVEGTPQAPAPAEPAR